MSDYPNVYGFCDAGCKREVPTKEEFDATKIVIQDKDGNLIKTLVLEVDEEAGTLNIKTSTT